MNWNEIFGQNTLKQQLKESIQSNRVGHAQLFLGKFGYGTMPLALAYAQEILVRENPSAASKIEHFNHLDLHFTFPIFKEKLGLCKVFYDDFREMLLENPYANFEDWAERLNSENKQLTIYAEEIEDLNERFNLKSYEGGTKVLIMWCANKMNVSSANKFLKFLEEPPKDTLIILLAETDQDFLPTILSRTQIVEVPRFSDEEISAYIKQNFQIEEYQIAEYVFQAQGDLNLAIKLVKQGDISTEFEELFAQWVREAFQLKKRPELLKNVIFWARNIASWNKEKQKKFLDYCAQMFRLAMLQNYGMPDLVYTKVKVNQFKWDKFSEYIHGANIEDILSEISQADYHLQRNANAKIVWTDMGIKLSRYIHRSPM